MSNTSVVNFAPKDTDVYTTFQTFKPITQLQLLAVNTQKSYPFADRLMEYLSGNVIDKLDTIHDNTIRVQEIMYKNRIPYRIYGIWDSNIVPEMYTYTAIKGLEQNQILNKDSLGYVDKQTEKIYSASGLTTLSNINIYDEKDLTLSGGHLNG